MSESAQKRHFDRAPITSGLPPESRQRYGNAKNFCRNQAIAACGGDAREAVKALIVANQFLETDLEKLKAAVSMGYARRKLFEPVPRDRKDSLSAPVSAQARAKIA
jgi:hypothetical protein